MLGTAGAFESPATAALLPLITPQGALQRAQPRLSGATQVATITGPALGGLAYAVSPGLPYGVMVLFWLLGALFTGAIQVIQPAAPGKGFNEPGRSLRRRSFHSRQSAILGTIVSTGSRCCRASRPRRSIRAISLRPDLPASASSCRARGRCVGDDLAARAPAYSPTCRHRCSSLIVFGTATWSSPCRTGCGFRCWRWLCWKPPIRSAW